MITRDSIYWPHYFSMMDRCQDDGFGNFIKRPQGMGVGEFVLEDLH